jgi:hypothetical protein
VTTKSGGTLADLLLAEVRRQRALEALSENAAADIESDPATECEEEADGNCGARGE